MNIIKKGLSSFIFHFSGSLIGILTQLFAAKILNVEDFGKANYIFGLASTITIFFYFGISYYLPKIFQKDSVDKTKIFSSAFLASLLLFGLFSVFFIILLKNKFSGINLALILIIALLQYVLEYIRAYLIATNKADQASKYGNFYLRIGNLGSLLLLFFIFRNYYSLVVSIALSHLIVIIPFIPKIFKITKPSFSIIFSSKYFYIIQLLYFFLDYYSKVMQGDLYSMRSVSLLSIALLVGSAVSMFSQNFANVGLPVFAKAYIDNDINQMKLKFCEIARVNAYLIIPIFIFIALNAKSLLGLINHEYIQGSSMLILILVGVFFNSFVGPNGSVLLMTGKEKFELFNGTIKLIVGLSIVFFIGHKYIWGIALAICASEVVSNFLKAIEIYYFYGILPFNLRTILYLLIIIIIQSVVFFSSTLFIKNIYLLILVSVVEVILFWCLTFIFSNNPDDKRFFSETTIKSLFKNE